MVSVFKYRGGDWTIVKRDLSSLSKNQLYAAPFSSLNDPFESTVIVDNESFDVGGLILSRSRRVKPEHTQKFTSNLKDAADKFVNITKNFGVYSLSRTATDELLWAHYANSHQGFCLEFDLDKLMTYKMEGEKVLDVDYASCPPVISMAELVDFGESQDGLFKKLVATKSNRWNYEQEIRVCVGEPGSKEYDFRALKAIYFGARCSQRLIRLTMRLLRGRSLRYYQMRLALNSYNLEAIEISDTFTSAAPYRKRLAPVDDGIPYFDKNTEPYQKELMSAIEMARREPYCERVLGAYISGTKGTSENPYFYVSYDGSDGLPRNIYYSLAEIRAHPLYIDI